MKLHTTINGLPIDLEGSTAEIREFLRELRNETNITESSETIQSNLSIEPKPNIDPYPQISDFEQLLTDHPRLQRYSLREILRIKNLPFPSDPNVQSKLYMRLYRAKWKLKGGKEVDA